MYRMNRIQHNNTKKSGQRTHQICTQTMIIFPHRTGPNLELRCQCQSEPKACQQVSNDESYRTPHFDQALQWIIGAFHSSTNANAVEWFLQQTDLTGATIFSDSRWNVSCLTTTHSTTFLDLKKNNKFDEQEGRIRVPDGGSATMKQTNDTTPFIFQTTPIFRVCFIQNSNSASAHCHVLIDHITTILKQIEKTESYPAWYSNVDCTQEVGIKLSSRIKAS
jgi:hypothetical protein